MSGTSPISVALPCLNEAERLPRALAGIEHQTLQPRRVWVADGGSTDGTLQILQEWKNKLPLIVIENPDRRQGPGLNLCLQRCETPLLARLDGHTYWPPEYLETLSQDLRSNNTLGASGAVVSLGVDATSFQRDAWSVMKHPLGTGAPSYREGADSSFVESVQSPVYRTEALEEAGGFPEDFPWAEDDYLHHELRRRGWKLKLNETVELKYYPRNSTLSFLKQFNHYGRGRGLLGSRDIFPSSRHETIDRTLKLWTYGLCWNPIGWGLFVFYLLAALVITIEQIRTRKSTARFGYLMSVAHVSYWLGWLTTRFTNRPTASLNRG